MQTQNFEVQWSLNSELILKSSTVNFNLRHFGSAPLLHIQQLLFTNLWGVICTYKLFKFLNWQFFFCQLGELSPVHVILFCNLIGTARFRHWESTTSPANVTRHSPYFWGESQGTRLSVPLPYSQMFLERNPCLTLFSYPCYQNPGTTPMKLVQV